MGIFRDNIAREFIAVPDDKKGQIVYKWPDINIRRFSTAIVEPDQQALFVSRGEVVAALGPGKHAIDATEIPVLGNLIDYATKGDAYRAELYFLGTREYPGIKFGGRLDEVQDPQTTLIVTLRAFGEYSLRVVDPSKLILNLTGTIDVTSNDAITSWVNEQLFKVMRTSITTKLMAGEWPILGLSMHLPEIEQATLAAAGEQLATYGLAIARLGNVDINLNDDDNERLKKLAGDTAYSRLAGGFLQAAQAEALQGAGAGMAQGGGPGVGAAFIGTGLGMAGQMMQGQPGTPPGPGFAGGGPGFVTPPAPAGPEPAAPPATPAGATCTNCHAEPRPGAKFCDSCGTPVPASATCTNCHAELRLGAKFCDSCGTPVVAS